MADINLLREADLRQLFRLEDLCYDDVVLYLGTTRTAEGKSEANARAILAFQTYGVVPRRNVGNVSCPRCNLQLLSKTDRSRGLGWRFKCVGGHQFSPFTNTLLENVRLNDVGADRVLKLMFLWLDNMGVVQAAKYTRVANDTAVAWYSYFRDIAQKIVWHDFLPIGGPDDIVEVDETHLFRRKCNVGRLVMFRRIWLFGGISRSTKQCFAFVVHERSKEVLRPIMEQCIQYESVICSDEWRAYTDCDDYFAEHETVNHSENFLRPPKHEDPMWVPGGRFNPNCLDKQWIGPPPAANMEPVRIHTQNIERLWRHLKKSLRKCQSVELVESYVGEFLYRYNILKGIPGDRRRLVRFLSDTGRAYPGVGKERMEVDVMNCQCHECV